MQILILFVLILAIAGCTTSKKSVVVTPLEISHNQHSTNNTKVVEISPETKLLPKEKPESNKPSIATNNIDLPGTNRWIFVDSIADKSWKVDYLNGEYPKKCVISRQNRRLEIIEDTQMCKIDGVAVYLGFNPRWENGKCAIHSADFVSTIQPIVENKPIFVGEKPIIVVDPGHGGSDPGSSNILNGKPEKEYTLDIARRLKTALETYGWRVVMTRTNDSRVERPARALISQNSQVDAFVSIHLNYFDKSVNVQGLETYCLTPAGLPSTLSRGFSDNRETNYVNNSFDVSNIKLAVEVHKSIINKLKPVDRGVRRARFMEVLQNQKCPAILVEAGYLSSRNEAALIEKPEYRQSIADAIAEGLKNLYNRGN